MCYNIYTMERLRSRRSAALLLCIGALGLVGCGANKAGTGNEFKIRAEVRSVGKHSVNVNVREVQEAEGEAVGWFTDDEPHRVHDNHETCDILSDDLKMVGEQYDAHGNPESLKDVEAGEIVILTGKIRDSYTSCGKYSHYEGRPVYDILAEEPR